MSDVTLPAQVDFEKLANNKAELSGDLPLLALERMQGLLASDQGQLHIEIGFDKDADGRARCQGRYHLDCELICQRCLQAMTYQLEHSFAVCAVATAAAQVALDRDIHSTITHGEPVSLASLIEDEILLQLPQVPRHEPEACALDLTAWQTDSSDEKRHPFAKLADYKK